MSASTITPNQRRSIVARYTKGESAPVIAADLKVSSGAVYTVLRAEGVNRRPRGSRSKV